MAMRPRFGGNTALAIEPAIPAARPAPVATVNPDVLPKLTVVEAPAAAPEHEPIEVLDLAGMAAYSAPELGPGERLYLSAPHGAEALVSAAQIIRHAAEAGHAGAIRCHVRDGLLHVRAELGERRRFAYEFFAGMLPDCELHPAAVLSLLFCCCDGNRGALQFCWPGGVQGPGGFPPLRIVQVGGYYRLDCLTGGYTVYERGYSKPATLVPYEWRSVGRSSADCRKGVRMDVRCDAAAKPFISLSAGLFRQALAMVLPGGCKLKGGSHYNNGLYLNLGASWLDLVATDGHRMHLYRIDGLGGAEREPVDTGGKLNKTGLLLSLVDLAELLRLLPNPGKRGSGKAHDDAMSSGLAITFGDHFATFTWSGLKGGSLKCSRIATTFPPYESVIPRDVTASAVCRVDELLPACKASQIVNRNADTNPVMLLEQTADGLAIESYAGRDPNTYSAVVPADFSGIEHFKTRLNPFLLGDALAVLSGDAVVLKWSSQSAPLAIAAPRQPGWLAIVMPIRMD